MLDAHYFGSLIDDRPKSTTLPLYRRRLWREHQTIQDVRTLVVRSAAAYEAGGDPFVTLGDAILAAAHGAEMLLRMRVP